MNQPREQALYSFGEKENSRPLATPSVGFGGFRRLAMAGRHRNPLPHSFPRGGGGDAGNHPHPPPLHHSHHSYLPPHHRIDDYREPPRLPPHHHPDDFRDPSRLPPGHPDSFLEQPPHLRHFAGHGQGIGGAGGPLPPQPHVVAALEERLGAEIDEAHALLAQNQRLAATHVALVQEVAAARHELGRTARALASAQEDGDIRLREVRMLSPRPPTSFSVVNVFLFCALQIWVQKCIYLETA